MQTAADGASTGQVFADILPFHTISSELYHSAIFLG